jgi:glyoxalase superfamily protein
MGASSDERGQMATYRKVCIDAVSPEAEGPVLGKMLGLPWRPDDSGEGGLLGPEGRYLIWFNAVPGAETKSDRVRLDIRSRRWRGIQVDSADPLSQATWWARVLDGTSQADATGSWEVAGVPGMPVPLVFVPMTEPKTSPNRIHWDVTSDVGELTGIGATMLRPMGGDLRWHVMADPEGNEFCAFTAA